FEIIVDRERLVHALNQLIAAAAKLSQAGSVINAEFSHGREREVMVKISVSASNIAPEALQRTFDRSTNNTVTTTGHDRDETHISLNAFHEVVAMHGGRVFMNSTPGQG